MKLTKSALKQIIKEELLKEFAPSGGGDGGECEEYYAKMKSLAIEVGDLYEELRNNKNLYDTAVTMSKLPFVGFIGRNAMKNNNYQQDIVRTRKAIDSKLLKLQEHINGTPKCKGSDPDNPQAEEEILKMISQIRAEFFNDSGVADAVGDALKGL